MIPTLDLIEDQNKNNEFIIFRPKYNKSIIKKGKKKTNKKKIIKKKVKKSKKNWSLF